MKRNLGSMLALYPVPLTVAGAIVGGKASWMLIAHTGIVSHDRILISCVKTHYTCAGIKETGAVSVSLVNEAMLAKADYAGSVSGHSTDKSALFDWTPGEKTGAPIPAESPLVLECTVKDTYETGDFINFILSIDATLADEDKLTADGKPDYEKIAPVLFEFPSYTYLRTGTTIGKCLSFAGKEKP